MATRQVARRSAAQLSDVGQCLSTASELAQGRGQHLMQAASRQAQCPSINFGRVAVHPLVCCLVDSTLRVVLHSSDGQSSVQTSREVIRIGC